MRSVVADHPTPKKRKPTGVTKTTRSDPKKAKRALEKYFPYTSTDGTTRVATLSGTRPIEQINDYVFDPTIFSSESYPTSFPNDKQWPPQTAEDLLYAMGTEGEECVGNARYNGTLCSRPRCRHTISKWEKATPPWHTHFSLRETSNRGIGVFTKRAFKEGDTLGWYAGEIVRTDDPHVHNAYLLEMPIGYIPEDIMDDSDSGYASSQSSVAESIVAEESVMIDGERKGNWTRFINHSCRPHCEFRVRRVGKTRIMAIEAIRDVPAGVELTVSYGLDYYGPRSRRICYCGTSNCVSRFRRDREADEVWGRGSTRIKKCKRKAPPP
jgi:hypothetical protein